VCPIAGKIPYLANRGSCQGLLFVTSDGNGLTWQTFPTLLNPLLRSKTSPQHQELQHIVFGLEQPPLPQKPTTRIMLGRWCSHAYQRYLRTPPQDLVTLSKRLFAHLEH